VSQIRLWSGLQVRRMGLTEKPSSMRDIVPVFDIFGIDVD